MTLTLKNLDGVGGGVSDGTVPTAANLGASGVLHAGGGTMTGSAFRTAAAQEGSSLGVVLNVDTSGTIINFVPGNTTLNQISIGYFFTGPYGGTLSNACWLFGIRHSSGFIATLTWETSGNILFKDGSGTGTSRGTVATGLTRSSTQWYYASIVMNNGSGTASYTVKVYDVTAGFTQVGSTLSGSTAFTSTAAIAQVRVGSAGGSLGAGNSMGIDQIRYDDGGTTEILPASPGTTVTAVAAAVSAQAYAPAVQAGVTVVAAAATVAVQAQVGTTSVGVEVGVPSAAVTVQAVAPSVTTSTSATVPAVAATASVQARTPVITTGVNITAVKASVTSQAYAPAISAGGSVTITAPAATLAVTANPPTLIVGSTLALTKASVSAAAMTPTLSVGATIVAVRTSLTVQAQAPAVSVGGSVSISATAAVVTLHAYSPSVLVNATRNILVLAELGNRNKTGALDGRRWGGSL